MSMASGRSKSRKEATWDDLERLEEEKGLGVSKAFDNVEIDSSLPRNVPAATKFDDYNLMMGELIGEEPEALLKLNDTFFYLDPGKKDEVLLHEAMHGLEGKDRLIPELKYRKGISEEFQDDLVTAFNYGGIDSTEGVVQALAAELNDSNVGDYFRRYETRDTHQRWDEKGLDPDSELSGEISEFRSDVLMDLGDREIYDVEVSEGLYLEYGEFMGENYAVAVSGEDADVYGNEVAESYLEDLYQEVNVDEELDFESYEDEYGSTEFDDEFIPDIASEEFENDYEDDYQLEEASVQIEDPEIVAGEEGFSRAKAT